MSQAKTIQAVKTLTREHDLENWSIRDLAQRLGVTPSVIYHYFVSRDAIVNAIIGQLVDAVPLPDENLEWEARFMALAQNLRPTLLTHPGMTGRMIYGSLSAGVLSIFGASFRKLHEAGSRYYAPQACIMILSTILWIITTRNLRSPMRSKQRHDLSQMVAQMQILATKSPALTEVVQNYFVPLTDP